MDEAGSKGYETVAWGGVVAPKGTPPEVVAKLNAAIQKASQAPEVRTGSETSGAVPASGAPDEFKQSIDRETANTRSDPAPRVDFIVAGATLIDGGGGPSRQGDSAVRAGRIVASGEFAHAPGVPVIDARGSASAPGFIDSHTHDDGYSSAHPEMSPKVSQGITTVVTGNCGVSSAPSSRQEIPQPSDSSGPPESFRFETFRAWLQASADA
ncbi:hypothetical protein OY671_009030, partial [Metschnikowia pulcherrima]